MSTTISSNMNLPVPGVGSEPGPQYATDINNCLTLVDQHDHSNGSGVQITPSGININSVLSLNNNFLSNAAGMTFTAQSVTPANGTVYENGLDLYYVDGVGNNVRLTQSGAVSGTPGSIANLVSPASASYVAASKTFVWQSGTGIAANLDAASILIRNITPNSTNAITLQAPASLSSSYTITLPALPSVQSFMTIDNSGSISAPLALANGITASNIANGTITTTQISSTAAILGSQLSASANIVGTQLTSATLTGTQMSNNINLPGTAVKAGGFNVVTSNTNATLGLAIIRGTVNTSNVITAGEGFTITRVSTGIYTITWSAAFADIPVVVASSAGGNSTLATANSASTGGCTIDLFQNATRIDDFFSFIAIGQR